MLELKPCPFCAGEAKIMSTEQGVAVVCTNLHECGCRTKYYEDWSAIYGWSIWQKEQTAIEKAITAWNRRADNAD